MREEVDGLLFAVEKSMRYHQRRRGFLEFCHRCVMFLVIASGSAAFFDKAPNFNGMLAALLAALDLTLGFGTKARDHHVLFQRFADLNRRMRKAGEPTPELVAGWRDDRLAIETEEPPILWALEADCYNEVARAWGWRSDEPPRLAWYHRLLMHLWSFDQADFRHREPTTA